MKKIKKIKKRPNHDKVLDNRIKSNIGSNIDVEVRYDIIPGSLSRNYPIYGQFVSNFCYPTTLRIKF
ncbi:MAG: hypothetical protein ACFFCC_02020 [Promethearchaeota archaeon]